VIQIAAVIAAEAATLPRALRDAADRITVAPGRILRLPSLTHDRAIMRSRLAARWKSA